MLAVAFFLTLAFSASPARAADDPSLSVRIESPDTPTRNSSLDLTFTSLDLENRPVSVACYVKKPGESSYSQFDTTKSLPAGGGSDTCSLDSSYLNTQGDYHFYATADAGSGGEDSPVVTVTYDTEGPQQPVSYSKEHPSECRYIIKFKTANDNGQTVRIEIYSSDSTSFNTDAATRVGEVWLGSDQEGEFIHDRAADCNKEYYYVIRAFDTAGNQSAHRGDEVVSVTPGPVEEIVEAYATGTGEGTVLGQEDGDGEGDGQILGEEDQDTTSEEGEGLMSRAQDALQEATQGNRKWWLLALVLAILVGGYAFSRPKK